MQPSSGRIEAVIVDVDGTLVDSNDQHAQAWSEAFSEAGYPASAEDVWPLIGMGGDNLIALVTGWHEDDDQARKLSARRAEIFQSRYAGSIRTFPGVRDLLLRMRADNLQLVVASSASREDASMAIDVAGVGDLVAGVGDLVAEVVSADDAERSKPHPDVVHAALDQAGVRGPRALMLGDTPWDVEASSRAGVGIVALRCGGWKDDDLVGALAVYDDPADLLEHYDQSPFALPG